MFLFDSSFAADLSKPEAEIKRILDRAEAEIVFCRKWDERRLAYEIQGRRRGTYVLTYFKCRPDIIGGIERDAQLSENVLRLLVLRADHVTAERMNEFAPEKKTEAPPTEERMPEGDKKASEKPASADAVETNAEPVASSAGPDEADEATEL